MLRGITRKAGYVSEGVAEYGFSHPTHKTVPTYQYWNVAVTDHFCAANSDDIGTTTPGDLGNMDRQIQY